MVGRDQVPALALLTVGAVVLLAAAGAGYLAAQPPEYHHHVYRTGDPPTGREAVPYTELSPEAQRVFQQALDDPDGIYTTTDPDELPPELQYGDDPKQVYVRYDGATYGLVGTGGGAGHRAFYGFVAAVSFLVGTSFAGLGGLAYQRRSATIPLAVAGFFSVVALLLGVATSTPIPPHLVFQGAIVLLVLGALAYWLNGRLPTT